MLAHSLCLECCVQHNGNDYLFGSVYPCVERVKARQVCYLIIPLDFSMMHAQEFWASCWLRLRRLSFDVILCAAEDSIPWPCLQEQCLDGQDYHLLPHI